MRRPKVIFIDDDPDHLLICRLVFEKQNFDVSLFTHCASVDEFITSVASLCPDIIYVDHEMPGIDGGTIIRALKANPSTAKVPVLYFSGHTDIDELAKKYGADGYVCKPFDIDEIVKTAARHINKPAA